MTSDTPVLIALGACLVLMGYVFFAMWRHERDMKRLRQRGEKKDKV